MLLIAIRDRPPLIGFIRKIIEYHLMYQHACQNQRACVSYAITSHCLISVEFNIVVIGQNVVKNHGKCSKMLSRQLNSVHD